MGRPPADRSRDTRRKILDAALDLFAERGFHATSMRALAAAVGVRESALYHYFPAKDDLLAAVLADGAEDHPPPAEAGAPGIAEGPLEESLLRTALALAAAAESPRDRKRVRLVLSLGAGGDAGSPWRLVTDRPRRILTHLFRELRRAGRVRPDLDFEIFFAQFYGPLLVGGGALAGGKAAAPATPAKKFIRQHVALLARAIAPVRGSSAAPRRRKT